MLSAHHGVALAFILVIAGCGTAAPPPERPALASLLHEKKFEPHGDYTGADTPEDQQPLQAAVDDTIKDVSALPDPLNKETVRSRLAKLIDHTDLYATEDRDEVGRYAVRIWRAAGFREESHLFAVSDARVLAYP
jgi:hypothetical protein